MRTLLISALLISFATPAMAQTTPVTPCPFAAEELSRIFGQPFKAGVAEPGIIGKACTYQSGGIKLWIDAGPNPAPSAEMYRKMSNPPNTRWIPLAGDADKAVHMTPPADVSPFPFLSYERKGWLVNLTVTGVDEKTAIDRWNAKLVQLPRIP